MLQSPESFASGNNTFTHFRLGFKHCQSFTVLWKDILKKKRDGDGESFQVFWMVQAHISLLKSVSICSETCEVQESSSPRAAGHVWRSQWGHEPAGSPPYFCVSSDPGRDRGARDQNLSATWRRLWWGWGVQGADESPQGEMGHTQLTASWC